MPLSQMGTVSSTVCVVFLSGSEAGGDGEVGRMYFGISCYERDIHPASQLWSLPEPASMWSGEVNTALGPALSALAPD